jgi:uncharacterized membrane protein HdeD (DUF308 family)
MAWYLIAFWDRAPGQCAGRPQGELLVDRAAAGAAELVLAVWAVRSWQRSLVTLVTLVGVWAIFHGVSEIFAAFTVRQAGRRAEQLVR